MIRSFKDYDNVEDDLSDLYENSLFTNDAERADLVKDKSRVAHAFLFNFFGMLGLINATKPAQKKTILNFFKKDKKLRLSTIDDTNHDISLSVKLAHEAGFFKVETTVHEITKFFVKLKAGQVDHIDSTVAAKWADGLKADFHLNIANPVMRRAFVRFKADGGQTIDVSSLAVVFKKQIIKAGDAGDFGRFAKRFFGLTVIDPTTVTPVAPDPTPVAAPATTTAPTADGSTTPAPKLSYYQRQKLKKQQAAAAASAADIAAAEAAAAEAAKKAEEELQAKLKAENEAAKKKELIALKLSDAIACIEAAATRSWLFDDEVSTPKQLVSYVNIVDSVEKVAPVHISAAIDCKKLVNLVNGVEDSTSINNADAVLDSHTKDILDLQMEVTKFSKKYNVQLSFDLFIRTMLKSTHVRKATILPLMYMLIDDVPQDILSYVKPELSVTMKTIDLMLVSTAARHKAGKDRALKFILSKPEATERLFLEIGLIGRLFSLDTAYGSPPRYYFMEISNANEVEAGLDLIKAIGVSEVDAFERSLSVMGARMSLSRAIRFLEFASKENPEIVAGRGVDNVPQPTWNRLKKIGRDWLYAKFPTAADSLKRSIVTNAMFRYDPSAEDKGGTLARMLHNYYVPDLMKVGWSDSKFAREIGIKSSDYNFKQYPEKLGFDVNELLNKFPNDPLCLILKVRKDGLASIDPDKVLSLLVDQIGANTTIERAMRCTRELFLHAGGEADANKNIATAALLKVVKSNPTQYPTNIYSVGEMLMNVFPYCAKETIVDWLRFAKEQNNSIIMGAELYKNLHKSNKSTYTDVLTGIVQDSVGTDVEDYVNQIVESLSPHVVQKLRSNLVGASMLVDEIKSGEIKPFGEIDSARLKKIFLYNDINLSELLRGHVPKKKKGESYTEFFANAKKAITGKSVLDPAKVKYNPTADVKSINKVMVERDHAGRHGDTYPKIDKVYDANLEYPEFWEFRKNKFGDGTVQPAYHGTGGIAAGMILRYGFKVIKSSDPSVTGRMLGDGIYFSNKIDKVLQYVSNSGYSRQHGQKGYVMELDVNLGKRPTDYDAAGLGRDNIRSPEWCVREPKEQIRIIKVYEVTLLPKYKVDNFINEGVEYNGLKSFRQHLKEQAMNVGTSVTGYIFRDGMIPVPNEDGSEISYVDFEEAVNRGIISADMLEKTAQGPMVVFDNADEDIIYDERYADHMSGDALITYIDLFNRSKKSE